MEGSVIARNDLTEFRNYLRGRKQSARTIDEYYRGVAASMGYAGAGRCVTKGVVMSYKRHLQETYKITSANSILVTLNCFFHFKGWDDCRVGLFKVRRQLMGNENHKLTKKEYRRLIKAVWSSESKRLAVIMETTGNTGICVSELPFITVESLYTSRVEIYNRGKCRTIFTIRELRRLLLGYYRERGSLSGPVFVASGGIQMNKSNMWSEMKKLYIRAGIPRQKVFPHDLRHLFACTYYGTDEDLVHLTDILGHSDVRTTHIYTISIGEEQEVVMEKMKMII